MISCIYITTIMLSIFEKHALWAPRSISELVTFFSKHLTELTSMNIRRFSSKASRSSFRCLFSCKSNAFLSLSLVLVMKRSSRRRSSSFSRSIISSWGSVIARAEGVVS